MALSDPGPAHLKVQGHLGPMEPTCFVYVCVEWEVEEDEETIAGTRATRKKTKAAKTEKGLPSGHSGVAADDGSKTAKKKKWDTKVSNAFYK